MAPFDQLDLESDWDDWPWRTAADVTPDSLRALWVATVHRSRDALAEALSHGGLEQTTHDGMSLRRLLADMIEEYARHTEHADLLREHVDGATGEGPSQDFPGPMGVGARSRSMATTVRLAVLPVSPRSLQAASDASCVGFEIVLICLRGAPPTRPNPRCSCSTGASVAVRPRCPSPAGPAAYEGVAAYARRRSACCAHPDPTAPAGA